MSRALSESERLPLDQYNTPRELAEAIVKDLAIADCHRVLEPHVGHGNFVASLLARTPHVGVMDIDPGARGLGMPNVKARAGDFLAMPVPKKKLDWIVGNPPFRGWKDHATHALACAHNVAFILRVGTMTTLADRDFWRDNVPASVSIISPRPSFSGSGTDSASYCWAWWDGKAGRVSSRLYPAWPWRN